MAHKRPAVHGIFESMGRAVDESVEMAEALRSGRLTRRQFDSWYAKRSAQSKNLIVDLRQRTTRMLKPVATAIEQGTHAIRGAAPGSARRAHRRPRSASRAAGRRMSPRRA
jgi:hypothetical protein